MPWNRFSVPPLTSPKAYSKWFTIGLISFNLKAPSRISHSGLCVTVLSFIVKRPKMAHHGVWCPGAQWSVLAVVLCSVLVPSPTQGYIYAVSNLQTSTMNVIPWILLCECTSVLIHMLFLQHYSNMTSMLFEDLPAFFGPPLPKDGLMVRAEYWGKGA